MSTPVRDRSDHPRCGLMTCRRLAVCVVVNGKKRMARCGDHAWRVAHTGEHVVMPIEAVWPGAAQHEPHEDRHVA